MRRQLIQTGPHTTFCTVVQYGSNSPKRPLLLSTGFHHPKGGRQYYCSTVLLCFIGAYSVHTKRSVSRDLACLPAVIAQKTFLFSRASESTSNLLHPSPFLSPYSYSSSSPLLSFQHEKRFFYLGHPSSLFIYVRSTPPPVLGGLLRASAKP